MLEIGNYSPLKSLHPFVSHWDIWPLFWPLNHALGTLESSFAVVLPKLLQNLSQWEHEMLLEVLDPNEMKFSLSIYVNNQDITPWQSVLDSLRNVITENLTNTSSNLISEIFLSLTRSIFSNRECPNIGSIKRVSCYGASTDKVIRPAFLILSLYAAYLQNALIGAIPQFVKRALEGDKGLLIVTVELLKNGKRATIPQICKEQFHLIPRRGPTWSILSTHDYITNSSNIISTQFLTRWADTSSETSRHIRIRITYGFSCTLWCEHFLTTHRCTLFPWIEISSSIGYFRVGIWDDFAWSARSRIRWEDVRWRKRCKFIYAPS